MTKQITGIENIQELADEVGNLNDLFDDIIDHLDALCVEEHAELKRIDAAIEELNEKKETVYASMRERAPEAFEDQAKLKAAINHKKEALKRACHNIPVEELRTGAKFVAGSFDIAISKVATTVHYSDDVLSAWPEFEEMHLDGDSLVRRSVNAGVMERLVASGAISKAKVADYRYETKVRNPSVRITDTVNE